MHAELFLALACCCAVDSQLPTAPAPSDARAGESVAVRYARAQLQLAEANAKRVEQMNRKLERAVPESVVAEYRRDLEIARRQLDQAQRGAVDDEFQVWLLRAETEWKTAETNWKNAVAVNERAARAIEPLDVERMRLRAEVAKLLFERGRGLAKAGHESRLQWEVELLNNELQRVREETTRVSPFSRYYPMWR